MNDEYKKYLEENTDKLFYVIEYPGNAGDELIIESIRKMLADIGIKAVEDPDRADILLWPGGNLSMWRLNLKLLSEKAGRYNQKKICIGPSTITSKVYNVKRKLSRVGNSIDAVFARDIKSMQVLEEIFYDTNVKIGLGVDPVYAVGKEIVEKYLEEYRFDDSENGHTLIALREDFETGFLSFKVWSVLYKYVPYRYFMRFFGPRIKKKNKKLIAKILEDTGRGEDVVIRDVSQCSVDRFIEQIARSRDIHTNRLHVFLVGALMKKRVFVYSTAMHKIESIIETPLYDFSGVEIEIVVHNY